MRDFFRASRVWIQARRSRKVSLIVGTVLGAINQGDLIVNGEIVAELFWKIPMTYCVPYMVSTYAAVDALLRP